MNEELISVGEYITTFLAFVVGTLYGFSNLNSRLVATQEKLARFENEFYNEHDNISR